MAHCRKGVGGRWDRPLLLFLYRCNRVFYIFYLVNDPLRCQRQAEGTEQPCGDDSNTYIEIILFKQRQDAQRKEHTKDTRLRTPDENQHIARQNQTSIDRTNTTGNNKILNTIFISPNLRSLLYALNIPH